MIQEHDAGMISAKDFERLRENPQPYSRVAIAKKIARHIETADQHSQEYELACDIAYFLQKDASEIVRMALSETLSQSRYVPKHLVLLLANDDDAGVAVPVLRDSPMLDEEDILSFIATTGCELRLVAIAERRYLSVAISGMLVEKQVEGVTLTLLNNETAQISRNSYVLIKKWHRENETVMGRLAKRLPVPLSVLDDYAAAHTSSDQENIRVATIQSFASVSPDDIRRDIRLLMDEMVHLDPENTRALAEKLAAKGRLNTNLMLLALCMGLEDLFTSFLSVHTGIPHSEVKRMCEGSPEQFKVLFTKSKISSSLLPLTSWTLAGMYRLLKKGAAPCSAEFVAVMVRQMRDAESRGINFARTIGVPIATTLESVIAS